MNSVDPSGKRATAQASQPDFAFHTLGWKAFQDLCQHVVEDVLRRVVEVFREAQDGGQDAVFISKKEGVEATIQCKFTAKADRKLRKADFTAEEQTASELVRQGQAKTYVLLTNMSVAAPVAVAIKDRLRSLGVERPHVFGKEFLTQCIRRSARLRALVPRVYGLGDLSMILDERAAQQTSALLAHMLPTLKVYVPTRAHVEAVRTLSKHRIVLLLGDPATGKSTIAAILATIASEDPQSRCFKADGPDGVLDNWNPNEPRGFYWIDDAFGPNQVREDFVDRWIQLFPKVQAAMAAGNRFVLTSRRHIYEAAKPKLGSRNHPLLRDDQAIVDVGELSAKERQQIFYNHIRAGSQPKSWKVGIKAHLEFLAGQKGLLPEIARRLGHPAYTRNLRLDRDSLLRFVAEPREHLLQTIKELSKKHRAALTLVFLHYGLMPLRKHDAEKTSLIERYFKVDAESLGAAIVELKDSFLVEKVENGARYWAFKHPTIADAISAMLVDNVGMTELYLRGTAPMNLLRSVVCEGAVSGVPDAVIVPSHLEQLLVERLAELPDENGINNQLFSFLYFRCSDAAFRTFIQRVPSVFERRSSHFWNINLDAELNTHARAHRMGLLPDGVRMLAGYRMESALCEDLDASFLDDEDLLALMQPTTVLRLLIKMKKGMLEKFQEAISSIEDDADLDTDNDEIFREIEGTLDVLRKCFEGDEEALEIIRNVDRSIELAGERLDKKRREREREPDDDWIGQVAEKVYSARYGGGPSTTSAMGSGARSIFSDVDE